MASGTDRSVGSEILQAQILRIPRGGDEMYPEPCRTGCDQWAPWIARLVSYLLDQLRERITV